MVRIRSEFSRSVSVGGIQYDADKDGVITLPFVPTPEVLESLRAVGFDYAPDKVVKNPEPVKVPESEKYTDEQRKADLIKVASEQGIKLDARKSFDKIKADYEASVASLKEKG